MVQGVIYKTQTTTCFVELLAGAETELLPTSAAMIRLIVETLDLTLVEKFDNLGGRR